ncbi:MAG: hypothetical protein EXR92_05135 [Gemmatimonadetes bacterium]|nr:hypothetical protein [Gemmatimonadota bacterium]
MGRGPPRAARILRVLSVVLPGIVQAQMPPPDDRYLTLHTEHFRVTFPEDLEGLGRVRVGTAVNPDSSEFSVYVSSGWSF